MMFLGKNIQVSGRKIFSSAGYIRFQRDIHGRTKGHPKTFGRGDTAFGLPAPTFGDPVSVRPYNLRIKYNGKAYGIESLLCD